MPWRINAPTCNCCDVARSMSEAKSRLQAAHRPDSQGCAVRSTSECHLHQVLLKAEASTGNVASEQPGPFSYGSGSNRQVTGLR